MTYILLKRIGNLFLFGAGLTGLTCILMQLMVGLTLRLTMSQSACDERVAVQWFIGELIIPCIAVIVSSAAFAFRYLEGKAGFLDFYFRLIACSGVIVCVVTWTDLFPFLIGTC